LFVTNCTALLEALDLKNVITVGNSTGGVKSRATCATKPPPPAGKLYTEVQGIRVRYAPK
jgi:hypothetical protein